MKDTKRMLIAMAVALVVLFAWRMGMNALYKHQGGLKDAVSTLRRLAEAALAA